MKTVHVFVVEDVTPAGWDGAPIPSDVGFQTEKHNFEKIRDKDTFDVNLSGIVNVTTHAVVLLDLALEVDLNDAEKAELAQTLRPLFSLEDLSESEQRDRQNLERHYIGQSGKMDAALYFLVRLLAAAKWDGVVLVCSNNVTAPIRALVQMLGQRQAEGRKIVIETWDRGTATVNPQNAIKEGFDVFRREFNLLYWYLHPPPLGAGSSAKDVSWLEPRLIDGTHSAHNPGDSDFDRHWKEILAAFPQLQNVEHHCLKPVLCSYDQGGMNSREVPLEVLSALLGTVMSVEDAYANTLTMSAGIRFPVSPAFPFVLALRQWLHKSLLINEEPKEAILVLPCEKAAILAIRPTVMPLELAAKIGKCRDTNIGDFTKLLLQACSRVVRPDTMPPRASVRMFETLGMADESPCAFPWVTPHHIGVGWYWGRL